jgi:hypothetical protein
VRWPTPISHLGQRPDSAANKRTCKIRAVRAREVTRMI